MHSFPIHSHCHRVLNSTWMSLNLNSVWLLAIFLFLLFSNVNCASKKKKAKKDSPSYISIRTLQEMYTLNATHTCHGGGWLPDPVHISCICIKGVWALSTGYCDENTTIYTGDGHCFQINKKIRKLFNLDANKGKPFAGSNYLITSLGQKFQTVKKVHQLAPGERFNYLIRVNPKHPMFQKNLDTLTNEFSNSQCSPSIRREFQEGKNNYVYISQVTGKNHFSLGTPGWCDPNTVTPFWTLVIGQSFRLSDHEITEGKTGKPDRCPTLKVLPPKKKKDDDVYYFNSHLTTALGQNRSGSNGQTQDIETIQYNEFEFRLRVRGGFDDYSANYDLQWPVEDDAGDQIKLLDVQTKRMGGYYKKWLFYNRPGPKVLHVKELAYLQLARKLFIKTCKSPSVTVFAVNNLFRWFRWLLRESLDVYSFNQGSTTKDAHERILGALNSCYSQATPFVINYKKQCGGPPQAESVVSEGQTYKDADIVLPESAAHDISKMEVSLEFVYKIIMHVHHYCAGYFAGFPTDHSTLQVAFESLFSPLLKLRWKNPGNTMRLLEILWPTVQIPRLFEAVDTCVGASRAMSEYKTVMERPLEDDSPNGQPSEPGEKGRKKRSVPAPRNLWNHLGYCIENPKEVKARYGITDTCQEKE